MICKIIKSKQKGSVAAFETVLLMPIIVGIFAVMAMAWMGTMNHVMFKHLAEEMSQDMNVGAEGLKLLDSVNDPVRNVNSTSVGSVAFTYEGTYANKVGSEYIARHFKETEVNGGVKSVLMAQGVKRVAVKTSLDGNTSFTSVNQRLPSGTKVEVTIYYKTLNVPMRATSATYVV